MRRRLFVIATVSLGITAFRFKAPDPWSLRHIDLRVAVTAHALTGETHLLLSQVSAAREPIVLNLSDSMTVDSVRIGAGAGQRSAVFAREAGLVRIGVEALSGACVARSCSVGVWYHGTPLRRAVGIVERNGVLRAASYGLPNSAREWWPTLDVPTQKADSADIRITAPSALTAASNGIFVDKRVNADGTATTHWHVSSPIYSDVVSFAVADYVTRTSAVHSVAGRTLPLIFFVFPEDTIKADTDFSAVPRVLTFLESWLGAYPFAREKYGIAEMMRQSFREHQTLPSLGAALITGDHQVEQIIAHEAAHQWFGNSVTVTTWSDIWLNEGFSEYMAWQWVRTSRGAAAFDSLVADAEKQTYTGSLAHADSGGFNTMFGPLTFQKGPLVLVKLEQKIGQKAMKQALAAYVAKQRYGHGTLENFRAEAEKASGQKLSEFFAEWVER